MFKSVSENSVKSCGEGFWLWPRRRGRSIPAVGCNDRANAGHGQKTDRPEGFRGKGRLASLLLGHRPLADMLPRRASPGSLFPKNRTARNFQTRSQSKARTPKSKVAGHIRRAVTPVWKVGLWTLD